MKNQKKLCPFVVGIAAIAFLIVVSGCEQPGGPDPEPDPTPTPPPATEQTAIQFVNPGIFPVSVYFSPDRQPDSKIADIKPDGKSNAISWAASPSGYSFYFSFILYINDTQIPFAPDGDRGVMLARIDAEKTTQITIPAIENMYADTNALITSDVYLSIKNTGGYAFYLQRGNVIMDRHDFSSTTLVNPNETGLYKLEAGSASAYSLLVNATTYPLSLVSFATGHQYTMTYSGVSIYLDNDMALTLHNILSALNPVTGVTLNKTTTEIAIGGAETLSVVVAPANAAQKNVSWASNNEAVASVTGGVITAHAIGTAVITVTTEEGSFSATCVVTVTEPVTGVTLNKTSMDMLAGDTETLSAVIIPVNAGNKNVNWTSSDTAVATVSGGVVTAHATGTATITVTTVDGGYTAECAVTVTEPVMGITLSKTDVDMFIGDTETLSAVIIPADATNKNVSWASSNTTVATVSDGVVTAHVAGTTTITVTTEDGGYTTDCTVTVISKTGLYHTAISAANKIGNQNLSDALEYISDNAVNNRSYFIVLGANEAVAPKTLSYPGKSVSITLTGEGSRLISLSSNGSIFSVESGVTLILSSGINLIGRNYNTASLVAVNSGGTFIMEGNAVISGNTASSSTLGGGGVAVNSGTLTMKDNAAISGNTASSGSYNSSYGGGVYVDSGTLTMKDNATISGNTASSSYRAYGGGVYVSNGIFTMDDNTVISGNTASASGSYNASYGGGVYVSGGTFKKSGGIIYGSYESDSSLKNTASSDTYGHAVYVNSSPVKKRDTTADTDTVLDSTLNGSAGGWVDLLPDNLSLNEALAFINNNAETGSSYTITLKNNETIAPQTLSYSGKTVGITLVGGTVERTVSLSATGSLFTVNSGVTLALGNNITLQGLSYNTSSLVNVNGGALVMNTGSKISGNSISSSGYSSGGGVYVSGGAFTMNGGTISDNSTSYSGGGVHISSGTFTMKGGEISGNTVSSSGYGGGGGGVYFSGSTFTMEGGKISGNTASSSSSPEGGGVYFGSGTFTMKGGEISGNTVSSSGYGGGGGGVYFSGSTFTMEGGKINNNTFSNSVSIYVGGGVHISSGIFTMEDGEISGNTASGDGGGVDVSNNGTFTMEGGVISGNTASSGGGVYSSGTFTMEGGEISGNTASSGGGVYVSYQGIFTKSGGIIYGDIDTTHTAGSSENTATNGNGHAIGFLFGGKARNSTADTDVNLYAKYSGGWLYVDSAMGGVGDTTANWE
jgi:uncharacterized protein YjdB